MQNALGELRSVHIELTSVPGSTDVQELRRQLRTLCAVLSLVVQNRVSSSSRGVSSMSSSAAAAYGTRNEAVNVVGIPSTSKGPVTARMSTKPTMVVAADTTDQTVSTDPPGCALDDMLESIKGAKKAASQPVEPPKTPPQSEKKKAALPDTAGRADVEAVQTPASPAVTQDASEPLPRPLRRRPRSPKSRLVLTALLRRRRRGPLRRAPTTRSPRRLSLQVKMPARARTRRVVTSLATLVAAASMAVRPPRKAPTTTLRGVESEHNEESNESEKSESEESDEDDSEEEDDDEELDEVEEAEESEGGE